MTTKHDFTIQRYQDGEQIAPVRRICVEGKYVSDAPESLRQQYANPRDTPPEKRPFVEVGMHPTARIAPSKDYLIPDIVALRKKGIPWFDIGRKLKIKAETVQALARKGGMSIVPLRRRKDFPIAAKIKPGEHRPKCLAKECLSYSLILGLCGRHYQQWRNTGGERCEQCGAAVCEHTAKLGRIA